eukprot:6226641-Lingulodinium_polyedra.AAC.1
MQDFISRIQKADAADAGCLDAVAAAAKQLANLRAALRKGATMKLDEAIQKALAVAVRCLADE